MLGSLLSGSALALTAPPELQCQDVLFAENGRSAVISSSFFVTPEGRFNAEAERLASLAALDGAQGRDFACAFPYRYEWLRATHRDRPVPAFDLGGCAELAAFRPQGRRRGPRADHAASHELLVSPFLREAKLCGTCHDVGNVAVSKQGDGTYQYNLLNTESPSHDPGSSSRSSAPTPNGNSRRSRPAA